jgi:hypothetical protein
MPHFFFLSFLFSIVIRGQRVPKMSKKKKKNSHGLFLYDVFLRGKNDFVMIHRGEKRFIL